MFRKLGIGFVALAMLAPGIASALGVGDYELKSYLNQPFKMDVELTDIGDLSAEEVLVTLAPQQEFDAAGIERVYFLTDLNFEVEVNADGNGVLHITSVQPVREPYLNFLIEFLWPTGRLLREYTVLLDPPSYEGAETEQPQAPAQQAPAAVSSSPATSPAPIAPAQAPVSSEPRAVAQGSSQPIEVLDRQEYVVQSQDTMWRIALNNRPAQSISVQQMLVAIQTLNDDAFIDGNVNLVREGTVLRLPTEEEVRRISTREALTEIADQNREWRAKLEARGIKVPAPSRPQVDATRRTPSRNDSQVVPDEGQVTLVAPEAGEGKGSASGSQGNGSGADSRALQNELAISDERVDQLQRQNDELSSRMNDLSQQVNTSEQLLQLRNDQIAQLQKQLRQLQEEKGVTPTDPVVVEPVAPASGIEPTASEVADPELASEGTATDEMTESDPLASADDTTELSAGEEGMSDAAEGEVVAGEAADEAADVEPAVKPAPVVAPAPVVPPAPEPSFIEQNLMMIIGLAVVVIAALFGGLFIASRRRRQAEESFDADVDYEEYGDDDDFLAGGSDDSVADAFADEDQDIEAPADVGQDALEEVDVYTAYGRHAEAVTFLKNEIKKAPERSDLKVRLLEVLVEMRDTATFERESAAFAGNAEVAARLPDMRAQLGLGEEEGEPSLDDLELDLAADFEKKRPSHDDPIEYEAPTLDADDDGDDTLILGGDDEGFELDLESDNTGTSASAEEEFSLDDDSSDTLSLDALDDELSLELDDEPSVDPARQKELDDALNVAPSLNLSEPAGPDDELIDFGDLDVADASDEFTEAAETPSSEEIDLSLDDLELDIGLDDQPATSSNDLELELDDGDLSLDDELSLDAGDDELSLSLDEAEAALDESFTDDAPTAVGMPALDDSPAATVQRESLDDLNLDAPTDVHSAVSASDDNLSLGDEDDFEFLGDTDENATKLDLAKAYIDMGDAEGARDILNEVLAEGNDVQQAEAKDLLAQVG